MIQHNYLENKTRQDKTKQNKNKNKQTKNLNNDALHIEDLWEVNFYLFINSLAFYIIQHGIYIQENGAISHHKDRDSILTD